MKALSLMTITAGLSASVPLLACAQTPAQWVIFADGQSQRGQRQSGQPAAPAHDQPAVKVQPVTPGGEAPPDAAAPHSAQSPARREARAVPVQRPTSGSAQQDAPFVQLVQ